MYEVNFYQSGRYSTSLRVRTLREARKEVTEYINDLRSNHWLTNDRGFIKVGNLIRDNSLTIEHKAFGREAGAYILKV